MVSNQLGIDRACLQRWVKFYQEYGAAGLTPRALNPTYSKEFKLRVVRSIKEKGLSFKAASLKYNISTPSTVRTWYLPYINEGVKGLEKDRRGRPRSMKNKSKKSTSKLLSRRKNF